ncbi:GNAT family acetyltransferase [Legionella santicrucis]|uniref:GNAT family acetyltransferase n=1 Tax=Legionella santicrucis TaxID=45074 RepID=A0A0W0YU10_9GAMM|nr:GNAT family N-acetyltransferase [Legionella santicrucis]KTD60353.1 GNAT family acetyltransferase [Legionella santicrucis]
MSILVETSRLLIKTPILDDLEYWYLLHSDEHVMEYMGGVQSKSVIQEWLQSDILHYNKHHFTMGSVFEKNNNEFIGRAGLVYLDHNDNQPDIEIGYILHKKYWGQGYGVELVEALIDWGFAHLAVDKLVVVTRPENTKSKCLLEKCGFHYVRIIVFGNIDFLLYEVHK